MIKYKKLFVIGALFFGLFFMSRGVLDTIEQPAKGQLATAQLEDDYTGYVISTRLYGWLYSGTYVFLIPIVFWGYKEIKYLTKEENEKD